MKILVMKINILIYTCIQSSMDGQLYVQELIYLFQNNKFFYLLNIVEFMDARHLDRALN